MEKRLIELALESLQAKRAALEREIAELRAELATSIVRRTMPKRGMSPAARKAVSVRMKAYWARRRAAKAAVKMRAKAAK